MSLSDEFAIPHTILRHFDLSASPYTEQLSTSIRSRRAVYPDGKLFLDQLLAFAEIEGPNIYPPTTPAGLRRLLHAIHSSPLDRLKQDSFFYYLLRDYDAATASGHSNGHAPDMQVDETEIVDVKPSRADRFAKRRCLPRTWRVFMDGYWALDHESWDTAVACLSDPCISDINFVPQILSVLATRPSPPSRALSLVHTFLSFTLVPLSSPAEDEIKLIALASAGSLASAFDFIRTFEAGEQTPLREALWCWAFGARGGSGGRGVQPKTIKQLLHLPLLPDEHSHLLYFLTHPPRTIAPAALSALHDLVTLRLVHQGQYAESIQLDKESSGLAGSDTDRQRRREMVREFISILPETQRKALAIEGNDRVVKKDKERAEMVNGFTATDVDMGSSWVDVETPKEADNQIIAPSPQRMDTLGIAKSTALPTSPVPPSPAPARHSPFTGPPRFASTQQSPALLHRVLSGSPFALPRNVSLGSPAPKPRRIINDDDDPVEPTPSRPRGSARQSLAPQSPAPQPEEVQEQEQPAPRRSRRDRVVSGSSQTPQSSAPKPTKASQAEQPAQPAPAPAPAPTPRRTRGKSAGPNLSMPGTFEPQPETLTEESELEEGAADNAGHQNGQDGKTLPSRSTRTASKAVLDEPPQSVKRTRRTRETTVETPAQTRRSTRTTRGSTAQPSERGSPTPSVVSTARSEGRTRRRGVRESSVMSNISQTPRATRSRK